MTTKTPVMRQLITIATISHVFREILEVSSEQQHAKHARMQNSIAHKAMLFVMRFISGIARNGIAIPIAIINGRK